jgi:hypothetical protein
MYYFDTGIETSQLTSAYYTNQVKWFAEALRTNTAKHIILALHILYVNSSTIGSMFDEVTKCANAFNNRTTYTYDGVTYDYSAVTSGIVSFAIGGHTHADSDGTRNNIPYVISVNAAGYGPYTTLPIDLCKIDWTNNTLYLYRALIGGGGSVRQVIIL